MLSCYPEGLIKDLVELAARIAAHLPAARRYCPELCMLHLELIIGALRKDTLAGHSESFAMLDDALATSLDYRSASCVVDIRVRQEPGIPSEAMTAGVAGMLPKSWSRVGKNARVVACGRRVLTCSVARIKDLVFHALPTEAGKGGWSTP